MVKTLIKLCLTITVLILVSCETRETQPIPVELGTDYYPLAKGSFIVYNVKQTNYNLIQGNETKNFFLKEVVTDSALNDDKSITYIINRFRKNIDIAEWELDSVWTARIEQNQIIKVENNVPFVKLVFPVASGKMWNGNSYNVRGEEIYRMESVHQTLLINNFNFDSTLVQVQKNDSSSIAQDYRIEIYAKGVGMVYKKSIVTTNLQKDGSIVFPIEIDRGIDLTQTIVDYGKE